MDEKSNRGTKRKRYEQTEEPLRTRLAGKLHHQVKEVHKASKIARSQETQKVVKRLKDLRKKATTDKSIEGFETELSTLKGVDHNTVGNSAFRTKILKDHTLKSNEDVKAALAKEFNGHFLVPAEPGTTLAKIQGRLLSSKILATQISASVESLKILLDPSPKQAAASVASKKDAMEQSPSRPNKSLKSSTSDGPTTSSQMTAQQHSNATIEENDDSDDDSQGVETSSPRNLGGWESGSLDGEDAGADDGWESGSVGSAPGQNGSDDDDESVSEDNSESDNEDLNVRPSRSNTSKAPVKAAPSLTSKNNSSSRIESTFLPSLAVGFVRGSDDSDFSDTEAQDADLPKKNRRGQRARRAIWEKKFGRNANHKKKEAELAAAQAAKSKNNGHTSKTRSGSNAIPATRSARSTTAQGPSATGKGTTRGSNVAQSKGVPVDSGWGGRSTGVSTATSRPTKAPPKRADEKPLHPSWEAKKRLKEKESAGIIPSQGVKIKFS